jgi:hypothetical protein
MAIFNEILVGRFNRSLQKLFGIKGSPPVRQVGGEIMPVHMLQSGIESRYLEGWNIFSVSPAGIVGAAGNSPTFRLTNDIATGVVGVIEKILVSTSVATIVDIQWSAPAVLVAGHVPNLSALPNTQALDARSNSVGAVLAPSTSVNTNTSGQTIARIQTQANVPFDFIIGDLTEELPMTPQSLLNIFAEAAASTLLITIRWRERFLEESERV